MFKRFHEILAGSQWVSSGDRVLAALSGGPDSVALFHLLHASSGPLGFSLHAAHLDHSLRPESAEDARFVARLCASLDIPLVVEQCDVSAVARRQRQGLEEAGREQRREFLLRTARRHGCTVIALGHHRGDQAETLLHRLVRGSGLSGLAAMRPQNGPFIRPLLTFSRRQIIDFLVEQKIDFLEDASNQNRCFTRNRIRLDLLPLLREFNPRVEERLANLSRRIALEEDFWDQEVDKVLTDLRQGTNPRQPVDPAGKSGPEAWLDRARLLALHPALRARVLRRALGDLRGQLAGLSAVHLEAVEELVRSGPPQGELHLPGAWVARRYDGLWLRTSPPQVAEFGEFIVDGPGEWPLPDGRRLRFSLSVHPLEEGPGAVEFAADKVPFPLSVRPFRPGDRFRPRGGAGSGKIKKFFIDRKVDHEIRKTIPLVVAGEILWVVGMCRCAGLETGPASELVLRIEILPAF
jgi:tRNA(Ile)-lysidine synthase